MNTVLRTIFYRLAFSIFSFVLIINYVQSTEEERLPEESFTLKTLYEVKLDEGVIAERIRPLIEEGFTEERAKEIFAREYMGGVFLERFTMSDLVSLARKDLGEAFTISYNKDSKGVTDNLYVQQIVDLKTLCEEQDAVKYQGYLAGYKEVSTAYNEVYYLKDGQKISPLVITRDLVIKRNSYSIIWPSLTTYGGIKVESGCATVQVTYVPLSWVRTLWLLKGILESRLAESEYGHTITILRPDGTLTLYDVEKK
jgi:hypothetical protein